VPSWLLTPAAQGAISLLTGSEREPDLLVLRSWPTAVA